VSSILAFHQEALPTLRYFANDAEVALVMPAGIALDPTSCQEDGEGVNWGARDTVKAESSGEDPRATEGLVSNLPRPRVNKTKQHSHLSQPPPHTHTLHTTCQRIL